MVAPSDYTSPAMAFSGYQGKYANVVRTSLYIGTRSSFTFTQNHPINRKNEEEAR